MDTRNKTLLISAAAGSGKTATLTERIIRRITDKEAPADISQMLIVTFTRAAAAELRSRIFGALSDTLSSDHSNKHLASQLMKIGSAKICTIDSFYLDVIKANFSSLDLPASFRLADDSEYALIARDALE
jgi:ATP-dependent helicase/nuclease subunit A